MIYRIIAIIALIVVYTSTKVVAMVTRPLPVAKRRRGRVIINGTFHNPNWFFAHIAPLAASDFGEIILVCDDPVAELPNLTYVHPPAWVGRVLSKAGARALWTLIHAIRRPADVFIGYHIFPSAVTALVCARLTGARAVYQVTSGSLELEGGGWHAENKLLVALGGPSRLVESLAHSVMREFELIVVRGSGARDYVEDHGYNGKIEIVTGSVDTNAPVAAKRDIDVTLVGRLTEYKRPDRFIEAVAAVVRKRDVCHAVIVGAGPEQVELETLAADLGIAEHVTFLGQRGDVLEILGRTRVFVLTSRWEGVSIAMLEAMAMGAVPVVSNVGDLSDFVKPGITGYLVEEADTKGFAEYISALLDDEELRDRMAFAGRQLVVDRCDRRKLASRWLDVLYQLSPEISDDTVTP